MTAQYRNYYRRFTHTSNMQRWVQRLRFNHVENCWQCWSFLKGAITEQWKWFNISAEDAKMMAGWGIPVNVEETVEIY